MKTLGIVGCGHLGSIVAKAWKEGLLPGYELIGVASRSEESAKRLAKETGCRSCASIEELIDMKPDFIAETASVKMVKEYALSILQHGIQLVVLSIGAFADADFFEKVKETAAENQVKVHIASGAIGGFDVLRTLHVMSLSGIGEEKAEIHNITNPPVFKRFPFFAERLTTEEDDCEVFCDTAKHAIEMLPTRVNVAVATAIATAGPTNTTSRMTSRPGVVGDYQHITASIPGYSADLNIYSSTSDIAGWSIVALLRNLDSPIQFQ